MSESTPPEGTSAAPEQTVDTAGTEDFLVFLARFPELVQELTDKFAQIKDEVRETGNTGSLSLKLKMSWADADSFGGRLVIDDDVTVVHPKVPRDTRAKYWLGEDGELLDYPPIPKGQGTLPFGGQL